MEGPTGRHPAVRVTAPSLVPPSPGLGIPRPATAVPTPTDPTTEDTQVTPGSQSQAGWKCSLRRAPGRRLWRLWTRRAERLSLVAEATEPYKATQCREEEARSRRSTERRWVWGPAGWTRADDRASTSCRGLSAGQVRVGTPVPSGALWAQDLSGARAPAVTSWGRHGVKCVTPVPPGPRGASRARRGARRCGDAAAGVGGLSLGIFGVFVQIDFDVRGGDIALLVLAPPDAGPPVPFVFLDDIQGFSFCY